MDKTKSDISSKNIVEFTGKVPDQLLKDEYFVLNDDYAVRLAGAQEAVHVILGDAEPWIAALAKLNAGGLRVDEAAKEVKRQALTCRKIAKTAMFKQLVQVFRCIEILKQPIPKSVRADMLWRIAVTNEKSKPDISRKAIVNLNDLLDPKEGVGRGEIKIIINNEQMPRGVLDG